MVIHLCGVISLPCLVRLSGQTRHTVLLWMECKIGPNPIDSSSTNRLKYANSSSHGNKETQEVVMMSPCVLSSSPPCGCFCFQGR